MKISNVLLQIGSNRVRFTAMKTRCPNQCMCESMSALVSIDANCRWWIAIAGYCCVWTPCYDTFTNLQRFKYYSILMHIACDDNDDGDVFGLGVSTAYARSRVAKNIISSDFCLTIVFWTNKWIMNFFWIRDQFAILCCDLKMVFNMINVFLFTPLFFISTRRHKIPSIAQESKPNNFAVLL